MKDLLGQENVAKTVAKFVKMLWNKHPPMFCGEKYL